MTCLIFCFAVAPKRRTFNCGFALGGGGGGFFWILGLKVGNWPFGEIANPNY